MNPLQNIFKVSMLLTGLVLFAGCEKLITVPPPRNTITTSQVFGNDVQAEGAVAGMYTLMINSGSVATERNLAKELWSAGMITLMTGMSAGEFVNPDGTDNAAYYALTTNRLTLITGAVTNNIWTTIYKSIYLANGIIEGIADSESGAFSAEARKQFSAEAKLVRALAYFYLINIYGDVPLALTVDHNQTKRMRKTPVQDIYRQIIQDLKDAREGLKTDFSQAAGERVRPNKFAASALLARVYLYTGDYPNAAAMATEVINETGSFGLETDLTKTFIATSREAIWQLKSNVTNGLMYATPEGYLLNSSQHTLTPQFNLMPHLLDAFEPGDKRRAWIDSTDNSSDNRPPVKSYYPLKYRIGQFNNTVSSPREYYVLLRLAEMYLIRSEARANGAEGGPAAGVADINVIRHRAGLDDLPEEMGKEDLLLAIEKERQVELFAEWGHRWFDLKRTNRATTVLSSISMKQPWQGDYQLLYPIPEKEIEYNNNLLQNPGYLF